jgi:hypothetical protein
VKLSWWQKIVVSLIESIGPGLVAAALATLKVDEVVAAVKPWVAKVVAKIPAGFRPQMRELLGKLSEFFAQLKNEIPA